MYVTYCFSSVDSIVIVITASIFDCSDQMFVKCSNYSEIVLQRSTELITDVNPHPGVLLIRSTTWLVVSGWDVDSDRGRMQHCLVKPSTASRIPLPSVTKQSQLSVSVLF